MRSYSKAKSFVGETKEELRVDRRARKTVKPLTRCDARPCLLQTRR